MRCHEAVFVHFILDKEHVTVAAHPKHAPKKWDCLYVYFIFGRVNELFIEA
jgi:hypothetical protein